MRRALLLAVTALLLAPAVAPVAASPAPVSVCPVCGYELESVAEANDVDLTIAHSEATARIHENGTTTWTARVRAETDSSLRALDDSVGLETAARAAFSGRGPAVDVRSAKLDDGTLVVRYVRSGHVSRSQGVIRYSGLRDDPGNYVYVELGADRVTVEGPPGTVVARAPGGTIDDGRVQYTSLPGGDGPFVVFAPEGTAFPGVRATLSVFLPLLPVFARNAVLFVGVPTLAFAGGLSGVRRLVRDRSLDRSLVVRSVAALAAAVAGVIGAVAVASVVPGESVTLGLRGLEQVALGLPVLLAFPLGVVAHTTRRWNLALLGVLLPVALLLTYHFDVFQTGDYLFGLAALLAVLAGVLGTLASLPMFLLGVVAGADGGQSFRSSA